MKLGHAVIRTLSIGAVLAAGTAMGGAAMADPLDAATSRSPAALKAPPSIPTLLDADQKAGYARVFAAIRDGRWTDAQLQLDSLKPGPLHAIARAELYTAKGSPKVDVERLVETAVVHFGGLDVAFANAGIGSAARLVDLDVREWSRVLDVNLTGPYLLIKHAARRMGEGGSIVVTASLNAVQAGIGMGAYCASKAGVAMLVEVAALELGPKGIRVNAVGPGLVVRACDLRLGAPAHPGDTLRFTGTVAEDADGDVAVDVIGTVSVGEHVRARVTLGSAAAEGA